MTKREICEQLHLILESAILNAGDLRRKRNESGMKVAFHLAREIRKLILDISVPETEEEKRERMDDFMRSCGIAPAKEEK